VVSLIARMARLAPYLFAVYLALVAPSAHAEEQADIGDVVVLADGSFVRGTLVEYAAGQYAVLLTRGGQLRRFEAQEVRYAGPAEAAPQAPASPAQPAPSASPKGIAPVASAAPSSSPAVRFESSQPLEVLRRSGVSTTLSGATAGESYSPICTAPCSASLEPGSYTLALALPGSAPRRAATLELAGGSTVQIQYESRMGVRIGGFVVAIGGGALGLGLMLTDIDDDLGGQFWAGCAVTALANVVGWIMAATPDAVDMRLAR
jgi:hypothetical protein